MCDLHIKGFRPEWCISVSTVYHVWDTPFWLGTLDINNNNNNSRIQRRYLRSFTISSQRHEVSNMYAQVARAQSCANHVQHFECLSRTSVMLRATWYEGTAQLLSLTELKLHLFELFILLAEPLNQWRRGGNRSTRRKPLATSFRKCHILQPKDSNPKRDLNPCSSIGGRLGKQTC